MKRAYAVVALLTVTLISLEIAWTRVFSAEFFYPFAFLILSLAVLGLGLGALAVRLIPALAREERLPLLLVLTGLATLAGPPLVFRLGLDFSLLYQSWGMIGRLLVALFLLNAPQMLGGMALASIFRRRHEALPKLYMADLLGAGFGIFALFLAMNGFGTPAATFLCALPVLAAAFLAGGLRMRAAAVALAAVMTLLAGQADGLLAAKREERAPVVYQHWDAVSKIKVYEFDEDARGINMDNVSNSPVYRFDGNWDRPDSLRFGFGIDVSWLIGLFDGCTFLSLGSGGGTDVLQALQAGATRVHAVEVLPHVNHMMTSGFLADYSGRIYHDPRVTVATEDGRAYVRAHPNTFDVIYSLSSNTFAALASGAFAMAENYLFTTEAFADYWRAMTPQGFMMMEHQYYMPRLVSMALDALRGLGVAEPTQHLAIYDLPAMRRKMILLSKRPLTDEIRTHAFGELTPELAGDIHLLYPAPPEYADNPIDRIVRNGWGAEMDSAAADLSPATDNRPFVAQLGLWRNFEIDPSKPLRPYGEFQGFPLSKAIIAVILLVVLALVVPLNLLPFARRGAKLGAAPWLFFFLLGMGFMMVEVILIQQYTLLIGPGAYGLAAILLTLLVACGLGSRLSGHVPAPAAFGAILAWLGLDALAFPLLAATCGGLPMTARILIAAAAVAPLGFFLGMPFPKGGLRVGSLIDWGYAVNGAGSVLGATLIVLVAFNFGYRMALLLAALLYACAGILLTRVPGWHAAEAEEIELASCILPRRLAVPEAGAGCDSRRIQVSIGEGVDPD